MMDKFIEKALNKKFRFDFAKPKDNAYLKMLEEFGKAHDEIEKCWKKINEKENR